MSVALAAFEPSSAYYHHVAHGYNLIANTCARVEAENWAGRRLGWRVQSALFRTFPPGRGSLRSWSSGSCHEVTGS